MLREVLHYNLFVGNFYDLRAINAKGFAGVTTGQMNRLNEIAIQAGLPVKTLAFIKCEGGEYKVVEGLSIDEFSQACINKTLKELQEEQAGVAHLV